MQKRKVGRPALELDMDMVIGLYKKHWSIEAIAAKIGVSQMTVWRKLKEKGVPKNDNSGNSKLNREGGTQATSATTGNETPNL